MEQRLPRKMINFASIIPVQKIMNTEITQTEIDWLCRAVEQKMQMPMSCPRDFVVLSRSIARDVGDTLSSTTLKRIWGYLSDGTRPQWSSLSVLARYVGFSSWAQFHHFYHSKITPPRYRFCKLGMSKMRSSIFFELRIFFVFLGQLSLLCRQNFVILLRTLIY